MADTTEEQLVEALEAVIGEDLTTEAVVAWLHDNAEDVCHLLGGAGPEEVERAKTRLHHIIAGEDRNSATDLLDALAAYDILRGKEQA